MIMKFGADIPIRNKIIIMVLAATVPALLLSSSIFLYNDLKLLKQEMVKNLTVVAEVVADNCGSSIIFDDVEMAAKTLSSLKTEQQIVSAAIFDSHDKIFASYTSDAWPHFAPPTTLKVGKTTTEDYIEIVLPVIFESEILGKIYLHAKLEGYKSRKKNILLFGGLTFTGVLFIATLVTIKMQGIISKPILALADTAQIISESSNYSLRAGYEGKDEIGTLHSCFNEMLLQIENRDKDLKAYRNDLENKINESREISAKLLISEARFKQVILDAPIPIMVHDDAGQVLMISRRWTELSGYSPDDIPTISDWVNKAYGKDQADNVQQIIKKIFESEDLMHEGEFNITSSNGENKTWEFYSKPFNDQVENRRYAISMAVDITERKIAEQSLKRSQEQLLHAEKLSATGKLSASISHEFNNPIYGIRNVLEMISDEVSMERAHQVFVDLAIKECNRMKDLIRKLQDFHRPTSDIITIIDINKLIDETCLWINKELNEKKIKLEKNYEEHLPSITGVFDQIKQVILNLLQNAEEAIPNEGGTISIKTHSSASTVNLEIQDDGVGVDPENVKKIFEPFFTNKSQVTGMGLGLSLSYGIIKAHGGNIEVESQQGKGTKFIISLPIKKEIA